MDKIKERLIIGDKGLLASTSVWGLVVLSIFTLGLTIWASVTGNNNDFKF